MSTTYSAIQGTATLSVFCFASLQPTALLMFLHAPKKHTQKKRAVCLQGQGRLAMPFLHRQSGWAACRWGGACSHPLPRSPQSQTGCARSCSKEACTVMLLEVGAAFHAMQYSAKLSLVLPVPSEAKCPQLKEHMPVCLALCLSCFPSVCYVVATACSAATCIGVSSYLPITTNPNICVFSASSQRQASRLLCSLVFVWITSWGLNLAGPALCDHSCSGMSSLCIYSASQGQQR